MAETDPGIDPRYAAQFQRGYDGPVLTQPPTTATTHSTRLAPLRIEGGPPATAARIPDPPHVVARAIADEEPVDVDEPEPAPHRHGSSGRCSRSASCCSPPRSWCSGSPRPTCARLSGATASRSRPLPACGARFPDPCSLRGSSPARSGSSCGHCDRVDDPTPIPGGPRSRRRDAHSVGPGAHHRRSSGAGGRERSLLLLLRRSAHGGGVHDLLDGRELAVLTRAGSCPGLCSPQRSPESRR